MEKNELNLVITELMREQGVTIRQDGQPYRRNSRTPYSYQNMLEVWDEEDFTPTRRDFNDAITYWVSTLDEQRHATHQEYTTDMAKFVDQYMETNGYYLDESGIIRRNDGGLHSDATFSGVKTAIYLEIHQENLRRVAASSEENRIPLLECKKELIEAAFTVKLSNLKYNQDMAIKESVKYNPNVEFNIDAWLNEIFDEFGLRGPREEAILMFKHMLWSIKRHLFCLPVNERHMFVFLSRKQGIGKTLMVTWLNRLWSNKHLSGAPLLALKSPKESKSLFNGKVCADFEELAAASEEGMPEALKVALTAFIYTARDNYANEATSAYARTCFVATSNLSVSDVLNDPTGMRRFFEFDLDPVSSKPIFNLAGHFEEDVLRRMYQTINENDEVGYYCSRPDFKNAKLISSIEHIQANYVNVEDKVEMYCRYEGKEIYRGDLENSTEILALGYEEITLDRFRKQFLRWLQKHGYRSWNLSTLRNVMKNRLILIQSVSKGNGETEVVYIRGKA